VAQSPQRDLRRVLNTTDPDLLAAAQASPRTADYRVS
jgi:hypothetical protein